MLVIPAKDPAMLFFRRRQELWDFLAKSIVKGTETAISLPAGSTGESIRGLLQIGMRNDYEIDNQSCRFAASAVFRISKNDLTGKAEFWSPNSIDPPMSPLKPVSGPSKGGLDESVKIANATFNSRQIYSFVPDQMATDSEMSAACTRAAIAYRKAISEAQSASVKAYRSLFQSLVGREKMENAWELSGRKVGAGTMGKELGTAVEQFINDHYQDFGFASHEQADQYSLQDGSLTLSPYLSFCVQYWDNVAKIVVRAEYEMPAPLFAPTDIGP
jgi:hypothetical protein